YGTFSIDADGNWSYELNNTHSDVQSLKEGETLTRTITVTSADGTASHDVTITIVGANDGPIAVDDEIFIAEDVVFNSTVDLDANDSDLDGDALSVIEGTFTTTEGGTIVIAADGSYSYTPPLDFNGVDTVEYTVTDGTATDTATLTINVGAENDAPDLVADVDSVDENTTVTADAANGVLS
ncbi:Ig-like domain-containing protein, partial [Shewanella sp. 3_MG-2023]|uniref:VCBS domain-containing protein n=1 Tax=Shewanella sp. 3_MG-2023 TaxID=3062635 RepID=UPI0026E1DDDE